jgi:membrane protein implicated in regulation of membrane protease activity
MGDFMSIFIFIFGLILTILELYAPGALLMGVGTGMMMMELGAWWLSDYV